MAYKAKTCHWWYILIKLCLHLFFISFINSIFKHNGDALLKNSTFWSFSFKRVYPLSACTASLIRHSSVDLNLFLTLLSCVLHNLWIFTQPHPLPFWDTYYFITDKLGWRQQNYVGSPLVSLLQPSRSVSVHLIIQKE